MNELNDVQLLDMDLNAVDTSLPIIQNGIYDLTIHESTIVEPTDTNASPVWKVELKTTQPTQTLPNAQGQIETLPPGYPVFTQTQLQPTGKATMKMCVQNVAQIVQAIKPALSGVKFQDIRQWHKTTQGRMIRCRVEAQPAGVSKTGKAYRAGNRVVEFIKN